MRRKFKNNLFIWIAIYLAISLLVNLFQENTQKNKQELIFSELLEKIDNDEVESVEIQENKIIGKLKNNQKFYTFGVYYEPLLDNLKNKKVKIRVLQPSRVKRTILLELISWSPFIILGLIYYLNVRKFSQGSSNPFKFAKSRAKALIQKNRITFNDVAGIDEAKDELKELVDFLKDPDKYTSIGAKIPRGCLLIGEPGTGKTLLAKAIAGEANVPFFFISGSDFVEMFVGVGASRVRDMFAEAKQHAPCIVFIDEIDAVGRHRGVGIGGGNDEREQTLNQLLVEMDGFEGNEGVIVIAATNRDDVLDKALLRPGRFDRQITIQLPDIKGREEILKVHAKKVKIAPNIDLKSIAKSTPGFSGAELANIINESALLAARNNRKIVTNEDIEEAKERVTMGVRNQSRLMTEEERKITAYHEAGHAVCTLHCSNSDPIHKVTIISRGHAGGYVSRLPEHDKVYKTKAEILDNITIAMGGRTAEELTFGKNMITGGASSDIKAATMYAKMMVTEWGMTNNIGNIFYADNLQYKGQYGSEACSDKTLQRIDTEIKSIISTCKRKAVNILTDHKHELELVAQALLKYETLTNEDIKKIIKGEPISDHEKEDIVVSHSFIGNLNKEISNDK